MFLWNISGDKVTHSRKKWNEGSLAGMVGVKEDSLRVIQCGQGSSLFEQPMVADKFFVSPALFMLLST